MPWHPQGKTSLAKSLLNFPGRYAWCFMESVGAINLLYILWHHQTNNNNSSSSGELPSHFQNGQGLPIWHKVTASLYVLHYLNRAFITPFFLAPSMSPIHLIIIMSAVTFNYLNSSCLANWLLGHGMPATSPSSIHPSSNSKTIHPVLAQLHDYLPYIGLVLFAVGMQGNIRAENTLFKLRRQEAHRLEALRRDNHKNSDGRKNKQSADTQPAPARKSMYDKVYVLPPATGYFRSILFPHYVYEWLEWAGFLLIGFSITPYAAGGELGINSDGAQSGLAGANAKAFPLASYYKPLAGFLVNKCGLSFPLPVIAFFVNCIMATSPRASWGRKWYVDRFGEEAVAGRGSFIPYFKWF